MDVPLDLSAHCIETELNRRYNRAISEYFKAGLQERKLLEPIIDMFRLALETLDFAKLRARYPAFCGGAHQNIRIACKDKHLFISIDDITIDPFDDT